jgi:hypothetical protein
MREMTGFLTGDEGKYQIAEEFDKFWDIPLPPTSSVLEIKYLPSGILI